MEKVHIGTMGWSYDFWIGNFYPEGILPKEFLHEYSKHYNTVEVDNTFYRIPNRDTVENWKNQTPANFLFSIKFPKVITHERMLKNCEGTAGRFIETISHLQAKLGPLLLQFPPRFKPNHIKLLSEFLPNLPKKYRFAIEVRNKKLLENGFYSLLRENGVALTWVDNPLMPLIETRTADFVYIRFEGDRRKVKGTIGEVEIDRRNDIALWAKKIRRLLNDSTEVFGYFSKYYSGHPTADAKYLLESL